MVFEWFLCSQKLKDNKINKSGSNGNNNEIYNSPNLNVKENVLSPKSKEMLRKTKSEENFMKFQVPWIL